MKYSHNLNDYPDYSARVRYILLMFMDDFMERTDIKQTQKSVERNKFVHELKLSKI